MHDLGKMNIHIITFDCYIPAVLDPVSYTHLDVYKRQGLAAAVANEGGIGVISAAGLGLLYKKLSPSNYTEAGNLGLAEEIRKAREKAKGIIGVNVMVALSDFAELVKTSIAEKVDIIFSGAGLPLRCV